MSDVAVEPQADDYTIDVRIRLPRAPYKRLRHVAEQKYRSTPALVAEAVLRAWLGGHFEVEQEAPRPRRKYTDPGVREELLELLAAGMKPADIGANFDVDSRTIHRWIAAATGSRPPAWAQPSEKVKTTSQKGKRPNVFGNADNVATFLTMYEAGHSDGEIARTLGCSESAVQAHRKMRGLLPQSTRGATS